MPEPQAITGRSSRNSPALLVGQDIDRRTGRASRRNAGLRGGQRLRARRQPQAAGRAPAGAPPQARRHQQARRRRGAGQPGLRARPCLAGSRSADPGDEAARRAALARWLSDPRNPLTWRSIVNRVWQHHFGRGIVDTPNDFGRMGRTPTHPELLDWLAAGSWRDGGSLKRLHRLIVTSAAYRQSHAPRPAAPRRSTPTTACSGG